MSMKKTTSQPAAIEHAPVVLDIEGLCLNDDDRRVRLSKAGQQHVEQEFSMAAMTRGYLTVFQSLFNALSRG